MQTGVLISSKGRPLILAETLECIRRQSVVPVQIVLSVTCEEDLPSSLPPDLNIKVVIGRKGTTAQLNRGLDALDATVQLVAVIDDDVELHDRYFEALAAAYTAYPWMQISNSTCLADGTLPREEARTLLAGAGMPPPAPPVPRHHGWGCCQTARRRVFEQVRYDERLPLYAWLGDIEWSERCKQAGFAIHTVTTALFCHLYVPQGRISGVGYGFSQIMNPAYFFKKGVMVSGWYDLVVGTILKCVLINLWGVVRRDPKIDRYGRLKGNLIAISCLLRGRVEPELLEKVVANGTPAVKSGTPAK